MTKERDNVDRPVWNSLGLCSGVGLLDLAVQLGCEQLGIDCRPAAACEWDSYAAATMLQRMEDQAMEPCPIWCGDLRDFDAKPFRGVVDVLAAGLPCQPYSVAGKQLGNSDRRSHGDDGDGPIPQFLRIVAECRPAVVFCENVPPWVRGGFFQPVGEELCRLGYEIEDPLFITAEAVGASHKRERVFVLAYNSFARSWQVSKSEGWNNATDTDRSRGVSHADGDVSSMRRAVQSMERNGQSVSELSSRKYSKELAIAAERRFGELRQSSERDGLVDWCDEAMAYAIRTERESGAGRRGVREGGEAVGIFAPCPDADWRDVPAYLWPAIEPGFRFMVDGCAVVVDASRADQLRCAGNAVVPLQAAVAFVELMRRVMSRR